MKAFYAGEEITERWLAVDSENDVNFMDALSYPFFFFLRLVSRGKKWI